MSVRRGRTWRARERRQKFIASRAGVSYYELLKWMMRKGYRPRGRLSVHVFPGTGRGLMTKKDVYVGDVIVSIPEELLITPHKVLKSEIGCHIKRFVPGATGKEVLSLFLVFEKARGKSSEWYPYIATLPASYTIPAYFSDSCLDACPQFVQKLAADQIEEVRISYEKVSHLLAALASLYSLGSSSSAFAFDLYLWAFSTVSTRCIYKNCNEMLKCYSSCTSCLALAPLLDMLNHSYSVKVEAAFNSSTKCYDIKSLSEFKKNSQIFINYGSHNNRTLLVEYGFVLHGNVNDSVPVQWEDILSSYRTAFESKVSSEKEKFLKGKNLLRFNYFNLLECLVTVIWRAFNSMFICCDGLSWNLETVLKVLSSNSDCWHWRSLAFIENVASKTEMMNFHHLLQKVLDRLMNEYDEMLLNIQTQGTVTEHLEMVHSLLLYEKQLIKICKTVGEEINCS